MKGGLFSFASKVLFPARDGEIIEKIVQLINSSTSKREATENEMNEIWHGHGGGPILLTVKLKDSEVIELQTMWHYNSKTVPNGTEVTGTAYKDRVQMTVESDGKKKVYTVSSEELATYVNKGWQDDMPSVIKFSITPDIIKPGEKVSISGDGSTEKEILVYISDGNSSSNEHYLIDKVPTDFGAWKWIGAINGRTIKTFDGKEVRLGEGRYWFEVQIGSSRLSGGMIDLTSF